MKKQYLVMACLFGGILSSQAEINSAEDLYGTYNAVYAWGFVDDNGNPDGEPDFLINPVISAGTDANQINITGLFPNEGGDFDLTADQPIVGTVDLSAGTITIANGQFLGTDKYGRNTLSILEYDYATESYSESANVIATFDENGNIIFPSIDIVGCKTSANAYWYLYGTLILQPYSGGYVRDANFFVGNYTTTFSWYTEDANGNPITSLPSDDSIQPSIVADSKNQYAVEIQNLFSYLNANLNVAADVLPSGDLKIDNFQVWEFGTNAYQLILFDTNLWFPDYILVSVDEQGKLEFSYDDAIGMGYYRGFNYTFQGLYAYFDLVMTNTAGVDSLEFDENAPVKYYNLNGLPINHPQKGQLVIKRQGNKSVKMIAR